jgi:hypothetical protein
MSKFQEELRALEQELEEGDITAKGFEKRKTKLLEKYKHLTEVFISKFIGSRI